VSSSEKKNKKKETPPETEKSKEEETEKSKEEETEKSKEEETEKSKEQETEKSKEQETVSEEKQDENAVNPSKTVSNFEQEIAEATSAQALEEIQKFAFNPNAFCEFKMGGTKEEIEEDERMVQQAAIYLTETVIPLMIEDFSWLMSVPVDGQTLTKVMHTRGINMRYLGQVATRAEKANVSIIQEIAIREMITRATKHIFRTYLQSVEDFNLSALISHFLNCFLGNAVELVDPDSKSKKTSGAFKKKKEN